MVMEIKRGSSTLRFIRPADGGGRWKKGAVWGAAAAYDWRLYG